MKVISRKEAMRLGYDRYFTGEYCKNGHIAPRRVNGFKCTGCEEGPYSKVNREAGENRRIAMERGERHYYSARQCPKGHKGLRYTSSGVCAECMSILSKSEKKKTYDKWYGEANKERISKRQKAYNEKNKDRKLEATMLWQKANPEKVRFYKANNKHKRRSVEKTGISGSDLGVWAGKQKKVCYWCNIACPNDYHVDHYHPLSKGGLHEESNLVIACAPCNLRKNAKDPYEFAQERGRLF